MRVVSSLQLQEVLQDALTVGEALGLQQEAAAAVAALQARMDAAKGLVASLPPLKHPKVCLLVGDAAARSCLLAVSASATHLSWAVTCLANIHSLTP